MSAPAAYGAVDPRTVRVTASTGSAAVGADPAGPDRSLLSATVGRQPDGRAARAASPHRGQRGSDQRTPAPRRRSRPAHPRASGGRRRQGVDEADPDQVVGRRSPRSCPSSADAARAPATEGGAAPTRSSPSRPAWASRALEVHFPARPKACARGRGPGGRAPGEPAAGRPPPTPDPDRTVDQDGGARSQRATRRAVGAVGEHRDDAVDVREQTGRSAPVRPTDCPRRPR